jgi:elongation factor Ts
MAVNMQLVKELRDRTQAGLNDCKSALAEAEGDMEKAVEVILKKGLAKSAKRAGAVAAEGVVTARVAADGRSGVIVEVNIQTDFAARNPDFLAFVESVLVVAENAPADADLLAAEFPGGGTVEDARAALVGRLGENITVRRSAKLTVENGIVHSYIHMGGKVGALLAVAAEARGEALSSFADNTAMHIAAMAPRYLTDTEVDADDKAKQVEIYEAQLRDEGKPEAAWPKIIEGKVQKWMKEICLLDQPSVLDSEKTIRQIQDEVSKQLGGVKLIGFVRYERGEGIEKKQDDFAAEAQRMAQG